MTTYIVVSTGSQAGEPVRNYVANTAYYSWTSRASQARRFTLTAARAQVERVFAMAGAVPAIFPATGGTEVTRSE